jgi:hypothetical protein
MIRLILESTSLPGRASVPRNLVLGLVLGLGFGRACLVLGLDLLLRRHLALDEVEEVDARPVDFVGIFGWIP